MNSLLLKRNFRIGVWSAVLAAAVLAVGCSTKHEVVVPAPNASLASPPESAESLDQGVRVVVETNAWDGHPRDLSENVIVLKVTIQNYSSHPLAVRYSHFYLAAANEQRYTDIPPYSVAGRTYEHLQPEWAYSNANYFSVPLPTEQMIEKGVSEGTIAEGGTTTGFLYFQKPAPKSQAICFKAVLVDAMTGESFGRVEVPLVVKTI
jgi:hypothetical protein